MICALEIALLVQGLIAIVTGQFWLSKTKVVRGVVARLLGLVAITPLPWGFGFAFGFGVLLGLDGAPEPGEPAMRWTGVILEVGAVFGCLLIIYGIGLPVAGPKSGAGPAAGPDDLPWAAPVDPYAGRYDAGDGWESPGPRTGGASAAGFAVAAAGAAVLVASPAAAWLYLSVEVDWARREQAAAGPPAVAPPGLAPEPAAPAARPPIPKLDQWHPPRPDPVPISPIRLNAYAAERLPGRVEKAMLGGGGRYIVLHFPALREVGVYDACELRMAHRLPLDEDRVFLAAGMNKLVAYLPTAGRIQRWDLGTGRREADQPFKTRPPTAFCMGSASAGPLLVNAAPSGARLFDITDFRPIKPPRSEGVWRVWGGRFWAAADGRWFGHTDDSGPANPWSGRLVVASDEVTDCSVQLGRVGYVIPAAGGRRVFASGHPPLTDILAKGPDGVGVEKPQNPVLNTFLPAAHGPFFFQVHFGANGVPNGPRTDDRVTGVTVFAYGSPNPVLNVPRTGHYDLGDPNARADVTRIEERVFLIPRAKLLAVINPSGTRLLLHPADAEVGLRRSGAAGVFILSDPPAQAVRGEPLRYHVTAFSNGGGLTYAVETGPAGLKVDPSGLVAWDVPADLVTPTVAVTIGVRDADGRSASQAFALTVRDPQAE